MSEQRYSVKEWNDEALQAASVSVAGQPAMKVRPILFSPEMVRALLKGRKHQTRRTKGLEFINENDPDNWNLARIRDGVAFFYYKRGPREIEVSCPFGKPGDLLYVKEAWAPRLDEDHLASRDIPIEQRWAWYWADGPDKTCRTGCAGAAGRVRSARFMPRWASRLTLKITEVRVQRVQEISEADAWAEGIPAEAVDKHFIFAVNAFCDLWKRINGADSWDRNDLVWAITFEVIAQNVDDYIASRAMAGPHDPRPTEHFIEQEPTGV